MRAFTVLGTKHHFPLKSTPLKSQPCKEKPIRERQVSTLCGVAIPIHMLQRPTIFQTHRNMLCSISATGALPRRPNLTPWSFFDWNFGGKNKETRPEPPYHDVDLSFPPSLVTKTFLKGRELKCCYKATADGFSAADFHRCCDFKGPCVIIGYTTKNLKFGAFNPEGYRSTDDYYDSFDPFLFYWPNEDGAGDPIVLPKVGGSGAALFDYARGGPQFGADGLLIGPPLAPVMGGFAGPDTNSGVGDLRQGKSRLGLSYSKRKDGKESIFGDESRAAIAEVEVFCSPQIASLY